MITIEKQAFLDGLRAVKCCSAKLDLQPILKDVRIKSENGHLCLTCTDISNAAQACVEANITEPIDICLNADKLESIVNCLDDIITIETKDAIAVVKSGKAEFKMIFINPDTFPNVKFATEGDKIEIGADIFKEGVTKTILATAQENNHILNGVCFNYTKDGFEIVATDGNRLSLVELNDAVEEEKQYIIPKKILLDVLKVLGDTVLLYLTNEKVTFYTNGIFYSCHLFDGKFPPYKQLIPTKFNYSIEVDRNALLKALERVSIMCDSRTNSTIFDFKQGTLELTTKYEGEMAKDSIDVEFANTLKVSFNYRYIMEGLKAMSTDTISFNMNNNASVCVIKGDYTYLVMPIQTKE